MSRRFIKYRTSDGFVLGEGFKNRGVIREVQEGISSRTLGVLSTDIFSKKILVVGVGSVGSYIAEQLVRSGVGAMIIMDPDVVEYANLSRTVYMAYDVGKSKVNRLAKRLKRINPGLEVECWRRDIQTCSSEELVGIFSKCDVIVATTDDPQAQRVINRFAYGLGKPAVFVGLYEGAEGGEVIISIPGETPCYQCATSVRHEMEQTTGEVGVKTDYGTGKLEGVVALGVDIQHVASASVKIILSLLVPSESNVKLKGFLAPAIEKGFSYLTFSMKDQYWFYPYIFEGTPGQYAYQSVWLSPLRNEECVVCGKIEQDIDSLMMTPVKMPTLANIRKAVD
ncbi:HesA/MoeB/ThiF family protein [Neobacillus sp. D3-1R]|uniref:HesA/MoeB/ThiF family protein n=1 Tax=Neobacillus sp. D3-1R TaxID=3445778 RepID=UPI003FA13DA7